jgi:hypothetical protein
MEIIRRGLKSGFSAEKYETFLMLRNPGYDPNQMIATAATAEYTKLPGPNNVPQHR